MKVLFKLSLFFLLVSIFAFTACERSLQNIETASEAAVSDDAVPVAGVPIEGSYIIVFKSEAVPIHHDQPLAKSAAMVRVAAEQVLNDAQISNASIKHIYASALPAFNALISAEEAAKLLDNTMVEHIEQDMVITKGPKFDDDDDDPPAAQVVPWGIARVGGGVSYTGSQVAWIIDSGVDLDHPDLHVDVSRSVTYVDRTYTADDDNGHGTHVAGTIAAIDNDIQVVGVAAGATVVAVKVLDKRGSGATSGVIAGVDYVAANAAPGDVANMSLGGGISDALDAAVLNASENGIYFALAAGNESDDANLHSPARVNGTYIYTISAFDANDFWAYFSNFGNPPVDYAAPGVNILSLYKGGGTATMSGTSMASPHVAGLLLLTNGNLSSDGYVISDPDGNADPIAHR